MQSFADQNRSVWLVGLTGELAGRRFLLREGSILGRSAGATVFLPDPKLQRSHCRVVMALGGLKLEACGRTASLAVNGRACHAHPLTVGDTVRIGRFDLRVDPAQAEIEPLREPRLVVSPQRNHRSAEPAPQCPARGSVPIHGRGAVLAVQWRSLHSSATPPELLIRLRRLVSRHVASLGGSWCVRDPAFPKIIWPAARANHRASPASSAAPASPATPDGQRVPGWTSHPAFSTALKIQWAAFLLARGQEDGVCSIGWADGELSWTKPGLVWGAAADQALLLALQGGVSEIWRREPDGAIQVHAALEGNRGRRQKYLLALPALLWRDGERVGRVMVRGAAWDPVTGRATVSLLSRLPLEPSLTYRIDARGADAGGFPVTVDASTALGNRLGHRATLARESSLTQFLDMISAPPLAGNGTGAPTESPPALRAA